MVQTQAKAPRTPAAHAGKAADTTAGLKNAVGRTAELSDEVLKSVAAGQRAALDAVRKFVDTVDEALPAIDGRPSMREKVIDAALDMADKLVTTQYDFLRNVVHSAEGALTSRGGAKE